MLEPLAGLDIADLDPDAFLEILKRDYTPDVELRTLPSGTGSGVGAHYAGWDGALRYLDEWLEPFSEYHVQNLDYIEAGECVLVPSRQWGVGSASGARTEIELTTLYELRDGQISRIEQYDTMAEARKAAEGR